MNAIWARGDPGARARAGRPRRRGARDRQPRGAMDLAASRGAHRWRRRAPPRCAAGGGGHRVRARARGVGRGLPPARAGGRGRRHRASAGPDTALKPHYRGWNGTTADHNFNWHDSIHPPATGGIWRRRQRGSPATTTGTALHTMGTAVGDDGRATRSAWLRREVHRLPEHGPEQRHSGALHRVLPSSSSRRIRSRHSRAGQPRARARRQPEPRGAALPRRAATRPTWAHPPGGRGAARGGHPDRQDFGGKRRRRLLDRPGPARHARRAVQHGRSLLPGQRLQATRWPRSARAGP
mgnify:CR=1 FL=1